MSVVYSADVFCDHRPTRDSAVCPEWRHGTTSRHVPPTTRRARDEVQRAAGWVRRFGPSSCGYDLCPDHAAEVPGETFPDWRSTR